MVLHVRRTTISLHIQRRGIDDLPSKTVRAGIAYLNTKRLPVIVADLLVTLEGYNLHC